MTLDQRRTALVNERTLLAYVRTCLSILIFGTAFYKFFENNPYSETVFIVSASISGIMLVVGAVRGL